MLILLHSSPVSLSVFHFFAIFPYIFPFRHSLSVIHWLSFPSPIYSSLSLLVYPFSHSSINYYSSILYHYSIFLFHSNNYSYVYSSLSSLHRYHTSPHTASSVSISLDLTLFHPFPFQASPFPFQIPPFPPTCS